MFLKLFQMGKILEAAAAKWQIQTLGNDRKGNAYQVQARLGTKRKSLNYRTGHFTTFLSSRAWYVRL